MASTTHSYNEYTGEPTLDDLFDEPIVRLFMERDHIDPQDMRGKLHRLLLDRSLAEA